MRHIILVEIEMKTNLVPAGTKCTYNKFSTHIRPLTGPLF